MQTLQKEHKTIYLILLAMIVILTFTNIGQSLTSDEIHHEVTDLQLKNSEQEAFIRAQYQINIDLDSRITDIEAKLP